jgi:hypothetical protein
MIRVYPQLQPPSHREAAVDARAMRNERLASARLNPKGRS